MARKLLLIGDPHAVVEELDDCRNLFRFVGELALEHGAEVVFLGDQHHNHSVVRVEVMSLYRETFDAYNQVGLKVKALVGNHDMAAESGDPLVHAMLAYKGQIDVVDKVRVEENIVFAPYYHDVQAFLRDVNVPNTNFLVCHQEFNGASYENGFFSGTGPEPAAVPQDFVVSGHIHLPQEFSKIHYVGAPRWRTLSDANTERSLWIYDVSADGVGRQSFSTGDVCRQIKHFVDSPEKPFTGDLDPKHDIRIDVHGPADYVEARRAELSQPSVRVRTFKTETKGVVVRESEGIGKAFGGYVDKFVPRFGTSTDRLKTMAQERIRA